MQKERLVKFEKAYNTVLKDSRGLRKMGAFQKVGDYRDVVDEATYKVLKKYKEELFEMEVLEIIKLLVKSIKWTRLSAMRTAKDINSQHYTNYISEFERFDIGFESEAFKQMEIKIDSELIGLPQLNLIVEGYNTGDFIREGTFENKRKAGYATKKQVNRYKKILEHESRLFD